MADDPEKFAQDEIEELLKQAKSAADSPPDPPAAKPPPAEQPAEGAVSQSEIEDLLSAGKGDEPAPLAPKQSASEPADGGAVSQSQIEELLAGNQGAAAPKPAAASSEPPAEGAVSQSQIEELLSANQGAPATQPPTPAPEKAATAETEAGAVSQSQIEDLLAAGQAAPAPPTPAPAPPTPAPAASPAVATATAPTAAPQQPRADDDINLLLEQAEQALASVDQPAPVEVEGVSPFQLNNLKGTPANTEKATLDLLRDVELNLKIELGRTHMYLEEVLKLRKGSVVTLDKLAGDPVDVYANGRMIARGEVLVLNDNFCVRVAELVSGDKS